MSEKKDHFALEAVAQTIEDALANAYRREPVQARMQAIVIQAENP